MDCLLLKFLWFYANSIESVPSQLRTQWTFKLDDKIWLISNGIMIALRICYCMYVEHFSSNCRFSPNSLNGLDTIRMPLYRLINIFFINNLPCKIKTPNRRIIKAASWFLNSEICVKFRFQAHGRWWYLYNLNVNHPSN